MLRTVFKESQTAENCPFGGQMEKIAKNPLPVHRAAIRAISGRNLQLSGNKWKRQSPIPYITTKQHLQAKIVDKLFTLFDFRVPTPGK
jgi:hypothetical protein